MKKFGLIMIAMLVLAGCSNTTKKDDDGKKEFCSIDDTDCETADMKDYDLLKDDSHVFLSTTFKKANELMQSKDFTGIIYFGYPTCAWCREAVPVMNEVAKDMDLSIYYVNVKADENMKDEDGKKKTTELIDSSVGLMKDENDEPRLYVPEVIIVKDGKIVDHNTGTVDGHDAPKAEMTKEQRKELVEIYTKIFKEVK